jgi:hypothetical protein
MASEAAKVVVPESVLRKRKREELWAAEKKEKAVAEKKQAGENRKVIFARAKQYAEEYDAQVRSLLMPRSIQRLCSGALSSVMWTAYAVRLVLICRFRLVRRKLIIAHDHMRFLMLEMQSASSS